MPDAFFATKNNRKRKRPSQDHPSSSKKQKPVQKSKRTRDEDLSDATQDDSDGIDNIDLRAPDVDPNAYSSQDEDENESPAEKRLRLAKLYLDTVKHGLTLADGEFDAAEIDRDLISSRLKQDVIEHAGKVHLFIADSFDFSSPSSLKTRGHRFSVTSAVSSRNILQQPYFYSSSKDGSIIKWDLRTGKKLHTFHKLRIPKDIQSKGKGKGKAGNTGSDPEVKGHTDEIWTLALSSDGKLLASGGKDGKIGIWDVEKNEWVKGFTGHRDSISSLAFRRLPSSSKNSTASSSTTPIHLYSSSFDRTLKLFDLAPSTMGYIETLFGHQAPVLAIDTLMKETAVSCGGRDKSVRFWKVPEESQLVFRGGGRSGWEDILATGEDGDGEREGETTGPSKGKIKMKNKFVEGSIESVAMIDENTFVTGGDSGSINLWTTQKKKPIFTLPVAHGMDESQIHSEDPPSVQIIRKPRWITALGCLAYSDLFVSGSWNGQINVYKLSPNLRSFALIQSIPTIGVVNTLQLISSPSATSTRFSWTTASDQLVNEPLRREDHVLLVAGVGTETRMGRWMEKKGEQGCLNGALVMLFKPKSRSRTLDEDI